MNEDELLFFEDETQEENFASPWKMIIADDEPEVELVLGDRACS